MKEKTYPYSPIRLKNMGMNRPMSEKLIMWLIVFLMRLGLAEYEISIREIETFAERYE